MKTMDLFDRIEDNSVQLRPIGVMDMKRIEELTMQKITVKPVRRHRSLGVYLLAAVLMIFALSSESSL